MSFMRDDMGRTGFTLLGIGRASVAIVHPVLALGKSECTENCLQTV